MGLKTLVSKLSGASRKNKAEKDHSAHVMQGVNPYWRKLTAGEIAGGEHRTFVGGEWEQIGKLQFEFLKAEGLEPHHNLVDVACGALRGGLHFVRYLESGRYHGLDINASLIEAARGELESAGLAHKDARLMVNDKFELSRFETSFDYGISVSLFTHLYMNHIVRCLAGMRKVMTQESRFYVTYFEAPEPVHLEPITHEPGGYVTTYDANPFHCAFDEMQSLARQTGLEARQIGDWGHPRNQKMICLERP